MALLPDIKRVEVHSETKVLVHFSNGIIKVFNLEPLMAGNINHPPDIKLSPQGAVLNNSINISEYDLWARSKFYGWDR